MYSVWKIHLDCKVNRSLNSPPLSSLEIMYSGISSRHLTSNSNLPPIRIPHFFRSPLGSLSRTLPHSLTFESGLLGIKSLSCNYHEAFQPPGQIHAYHFYFRGEVNLFGAPFSTEIAIHLLILWLHKSLHQTVHRLVLSKMSHLCN